MNGTSVIDGFFTKYDAAINSGFGLLGGEVAFLATTLVTIDVIIAALFWALGNSEEVIAHLIKKTLYIGFFALLITNWQNYATIIFNSFAGLGLKASSSTLTVQQFTQPSMIAQAGLNAGQPIKQAILQAFTFSGFSWEGVVNAVPLGIAWLIIILSFFFLAVQLFVTLVEFKLTMLAGFILVPFGLFSGTAFLAERVLGNVVTSGIKVMVLAIVVGIGTGLFSQFPQASGGAAVQLTLDQAYIVALAALTLLGLGIYGPGIATGLAAGAPQLGAGAAAGTASAVFGAGRAALATPGTVLAAGGATIRGGAAAVRGAGRVASFVSGRGLSSNNGGGNGGPSGGGGSAPPWARRMQRRQAMSQGLGALGRALRSGDHGGASTSVNLRGGNS
jgi:type IV secretion system protein TrbL